MYIDFIRLFIIFPLIFTVSTEFSIMERAKTARCSGITGSGLFVSSSQFFLRAQEDKIGCHDIDQPEIKVRRDVNSLLANLTG